MKLSECLNAPWHLDIVDLELFDCMQKLSACALVYPQSVFITENEFIKYMSRDIAYGGLKTCEVF